MYSNFWLVLYGGGKKATRYSDIFFESCALGLKELLTLWEMVRQPVAEEITIPVQPFSSSPPWLIF